MHPHVSKNRTEQAASAWGSGRNGTSLCWRGRSCDDGNKWGKRGPCSPSAAAGSVNTASRPCSRGRRPRAVWSRRLPGAIKPSRGGLAICLVSDAGKGEKAYIRDPKNCHMQLPREKHTQGLASWGGFSCGRGLRGGGGAPQLEVSHLRRFQLALLNLGAGWALAPAPRPGPF